VTLGGHVDQADDDWGGPESGARPVDPVDNDRVRDAPAVDRGNGLLLHMDVQDTDLAAPGRSGP
jgi:hypothetical protein